MLHECVHGALLCDPFPGETPTNIYSPQIGNQPQNKVTVTRKFNLVNQWVYESYLQEYEWGATYKSKDNSKTALRLFKAHCSLGKNSWKLEPKSFLPDFYTAWQVQGSLLSLAVLIAYITLEREGPCNACQFQGLLEICGLFTPWVLVLAAALEMECFSFEEITTEQHRNQMDPKVHLHLCLLLPRSFSESSLYFSLSSVRWVLTACFLHKVL